MRYTVICVIFLTSHSSFSQQQCGNCKITPKVTTFDFDVQVPQPNVADTTDQLWPEWKNLFIMAASVATNLKKNEGNCITFTMPPSTDTGGVQSGSVGGETFTNLPSNPNISANLSDYGNYLLTGVIKKSGEGYVVHAEVQSSCNRKVVASADIPFQLSSVVGNVNNIAEQAASRLSPLTDKIKKFELEERQKDKKLSLFQTSWGEPIKITPQKTTLKAGESTEFTIELKDCDGVPLVGREILFTEATFEGMKVYGTMGGTVTPAKVITDAKGMAKAKFTLQAGSKEAIINAHSPGNNVKGCASMFIGDAAINIRRTYSGYIKYNYQNIAECKNEAKNDCSVSTADNSENKAINYTASFYDDSEKGQGFIELSGDNEEQQATDVPKVMESGSITTDLTYKTDHVITCESAQKGQHTISITQSLSAGTLDHGRFSFSFPSGGKGGSLKLFMRFNTRSTTTAKVTLQPAQTISDEGTESFNFEIDREVNKEFTFTTEKTGGKTRLTINGTRTVNQGCNTKSTETIKAVIIEE